MKSTGMIRGVDKMGRVVIPKEIRNQLKIENNVLSWEYENAADDPNKDLTTETIKQSSTNAVLYIITNEKIGYNAVETQNGYKCLIEDICPIEVLCAI